MVLIVDDKPENIFSLKSILELHDFKTDAATSGEEALRKLLKNNYALIILDVQMPGMDGFEVAEAITGLNKTRDIPIIFLSAVNTHKRFVTKGFESGAVDYLTKPVDPDILILKVRNFYRLYEKANALKKAEQALTTTVNELHSILESIPQIAFTANPEGKIEFVNQAWYLYSASKNEFPPLHPAETPLEQQWKEHITLAKTMQMEVRLRKINGEHYQYYLLRATPVIVDGRIVKWVGTFTDINEQRQQSETLEKRVAERTHELLEMNRELELSNHDLQQFASVASHDLKEPLRKIQLFGNLIQEEKNLSATVANYLGKIIQSSARMSNLIDDLLNFARLSESVPFQKVDLQHVLDDIISDLELSIQEKNAVINVTNELPVIDAVPGLMRQLFQNIISNALKFSKPKESPIITIKTDMVDRPDADSAPEAGGRFCRIAISDEGIGFDTAYTHKIFTLFQRLNSREQFEGTGIGLAIAKKIVDKHNGLITAKSQLNQGTTFIIILPVQQADTTGLNIKEATITTTEK